MFIYLYLYLKCSFCSIHFILLLLVSSPSFIILSSLDFFFILSFFDCAFFIHCFFFIASYFFPVSTTYFSCFLFLILQILQISLLVFVKSNFLFLTKKKMFVISSLRRIVTINLYKRRL